MVQAGGHTKNRDGSLIYRFTPAQKKRAARFVGVQEAYAKGCTMTKGNRVSNDKEFQLPLLWYSLPLVLTWMQLLDLAILVFSSEKVGLCASLRSDRAPTNKLLTFNQRTVLRHQMA
jgi:hypothetical protein